MAANLFWFYDALVLGIALICTYVGGKRGLMRSVVLAALVVASMALSWLGSQVAAPIIYDSFIKEPVSTALSEASDKTDPINIVSDAVSGGNYGVEMTDDEIKALRTRTGDFFANIASELKNNGASEDEQLIGSGMETSVTEGMMNALVGDVVSPAVLDEILKNVSGAENSIKQVVSVFLQGSRPATASAMETIVIAPAIKAVLKGIIWIVLTFILMLISRIVADMFEGLNKIPIIGPVNIILGGLLGLAEAAVICYLIAQLVRIICYFTSDSLMFLNSSTANMTYVFRYLFNFDISSVL